MTNQQPRVCHWLKGSCQSNPPEAVLLRFPQCGLGSGGVQSPSVKHTAAFMESGGRSIENSVLIIKPNITNLPQRT